MMTIKSYPDGTFYPIIDEFVPHITFRINSYNDLWALRQIKDVYDFNHKPLSVTIPCIIDGQADRRFHNNESANLKLICNFINDMKFEKVSVFHPHNAEVVESLIDGVEIIDNSNFISQILKSFQSDYDYLNSSSPWYGLDNLVLMSTDAGGFKPLMKLADKLNWTGEVYSASKSRTWDGEKTKLVQQVDKQDFEGKNALIIDDLSVFGSTFIGLSELLKERNCGKLYLAISHITVTNPNPKLEKAFDQIFTTNSKYNSYGLTNLTIKKLF